MASHSAVTSPRTPPSPSPREGALDEAALQEGVRAAAKLALGATVGLSQKKSSFGSPPPPLAKDGDGGISTPRSHSSLSESGSSNKLKAYPSFASNSMASPLTPAYSESLRAPRVLSAFNDTGSEPDVRSERSENLLSFISIEEKRVKLRKESSDSGALGTRASSEYLDRIREDARHAEGSEGFNWQAHCEWRALCYSAAIPAAMAAAVVTAMYFSATIVPTGEKASTSCDTTEIEIMIDDQTPDCTPPGTPPHALRLTASALQHNDELVSCNESFSNSCSARNADDESPGKKGTADNTPPGQHNPLAELYPADSPCQEGGPKDATPSPTCSPRDAPPDAAGEIAGVAQERSDTVPPSPQTSEVDFTPKKSVRIKMPGDGSIVVIPLFTQEGDCLLRHVPGLPGEILTAEVFVMAQEEEYAFARNINLVAGLVTFTCGYPLLKSLPQKAGAQKGAAVHAFALSLIVFTLSVVFFVEDMHKGICFGTLAGFFVLLAMAYRLYMRGRKKKARFLGTDDIEKAKMRAAKKREKARKKFGAGPSPEFREAIREKWANDAKRKAEKKNNELK